MHDPAMLELGLGKVSSFWIAPIYYDIWVDFSLHRSLVIAVQKFKN